VTHPPAPDATPDVTAEEIGEFFDVAIGAGLLADGVPADSVAQMRDRHITAVLSSPTAVQGMVEMRNAMHRVIPSMEVLLARYAGPDVPVHGEGALPHGFGAGCNDDCNNIECPVRANHLRCTVDCLTSAGRNLLFIPAWRDILLDPDPDPDVG
jgi:hypothetical protein